MVTTAVIPVAGRGKRLKPLTDKIPKCMLKICKDKTILDHQLENLRRYGVDEIVVVTGYKQERVNTSFQVKKIVNERYDVTETTYSIFLAKDFLMGDVIIMDGDLIFNEKLLEMLLSSKSNSVLIDFSKRFCEEDMKVTIRDGFISDSSKDIEDQDGVWVGAAKISSFSLPEFKEVISNEKLWRCWWNVIINSMNTQFKAVGSQGYEWIEIDTKEDLEEACRLIKRWYNEI